MNVRRTITALTALASTLAGASAQTLDSNTPLSISGTFAPALLQSGSSRATSSGWNVAAIPCSTINEGDIDAAWCMNVLGSAPGSVGYYFDHDMAGSGADLGIGLANATLAQGPGYSTSERFLLKVDNGAVGGGDVERVQLDNSATNNGIWLGIWLGGYGNTLDDAAIRISTGNADGSDVWTTGIKLGSTWNTSLSEGSSGGPSGLEIGGTHRVGILSDATATYSKPAIVLPSDPTSSGVEGFSWWAETSGSASGNSAITATDLASSPCGLCVSVQATPSPSNAVNPISDVRFRRGGGISTESALGVGTDPGTSSVAAWSEAFAGKQAGTVALFPAGHVQGALYRLLSLKQRFSVTLDSTCVSANAAAEVETSGAYGATGALIWQSSRVLTGAATAAQTLSHSLTAASPIASVSLFASGTASTTCASDAKFEDLP